MRHLAGVLVLLLGCSQPQQNLSSEATDASGDMETVDTHEGLDVDRLIEDLISQLPAQSDPHVILLREDIPNYTFNQQLDVTTYVEQVRQSFEKTGRVSLIKVDAGPSDWTCSIVISDSSRTSNRTLRVAITDSNGGMVAAQSASWKASRPRSEN